MMNSPPLDAAAVKPDAAASSSKRKESAPLLAYRLMIFYRFALALVGGYALASLSAMLIAQYFMDYRASAAALRERTALLEQQLEQSGTKRSV